MHKEGAGTFTRVWLPVLAWLTSRVWLVVAGLVPLSWYPAGTLVFDDIEVYVRWLPSIAAGELPVDEMWQYPPAAAIVFAIGLIGSTPTAVLVGAFVFVDLVLTVVLYRHSSTAGWFWIASGLVIGPVLLYRFDVVPALLAVLAILAANRPVRVGVWTALGAALKLWPVLLLIILPKRQVLRGVTVFAVVSLALLGVTFLLFDEIGGFLAGQRGRGLQIESVAALPFMIGNAFGGDVEMTYRFGAMEVDSSGAGTAAALTTAGLILALGWLGLCWWRGVLATHLPADVALTVVLTSVTFSRVFSPQYSIWLLAIGGLCVASSRSRLRPPVILLLIAAGLAQILYPWGYAGFMIGEWFPVLLQTVRIGLVVVACIFALARMSRPAESLAVDVTERRETLPQA